MSSQRASTCPVDDRGWLQLRLSFHSKTCKLVAQAIEIRTDQVAAGELTTLARHPARTMRMRDHHMNVLRSHGCHRSYSISDAHQLRRVQNAMIHGNQDLIIRSRFVCRCQPQQRCRQRSMNPRRLIMQRSAPHSMIDPNRRSNIATNDSRSNLCLRSRNTGHRFLT